MTIKITRTTADVIESLPHEEIMKIQKLAEEIRELTAASEFAIQPPSPAHCYLMEKAGWVWDFDRGNYS